MSETTPAPKPTQKPWHEAAAREIQRSAYHIECEVPEAVINGELHRFAAIIAKHDPANARPVEFMPGQVWRQKDGDTRTIIKVSENCIHWRWTSDLHRYVYYSTYKQMVQLAKSSQLIEDPNETTPDPTSGLDHTQETI